jgi:hypothetical protein
MLKAPVFPWERGKSKTKMGDLIRLEFGLQPASTGFNRLQPASTGFNRLKPAETRIPTYRIAPLQRWLASERLHPAPLLEWKRRIEAAQAGGEGLLQVLLFLREDNADAEHLKSCSPFVGI